MLTDLNIKNVSVTYDDNAIIQGVDFRLMAGQIGCLLGPSGCGKSTLLRAIAGFEVISTGSIELDGKPLSKPGFMVNPEQRDIGMVFQDIALFPHLSISENIEFGIQHWSKSERKERTQHLLNLVGLSGFETRYPQSLSGGQQQRIALARAIAPKPKLLLMDEPFSGLDAKLREELVPDVRAILLAENMSAILVSHDQMEAFAMADQIAVMSEGQIHQLATAYQIYHKPATRFVASFIGHGDLLPSKACGPTCVVSDLGEIKGQTEHGFKADEEIDLLIRPDDILHDDDSKFTGEIVSKLFRGSHFLYRVRLASGKVVYCFASSHHDHCIGQSIGLSVNLDHLVLFPRDA
jgi:iron(III) transport system ATP-binding protein